MNAASNRARDGHGGEIPFHVNVLGHFEVWHGDHDLTPPKGHCAALIQLLALHDGTIHVDTLVDTLWPDDPPWTGRQRLRNVLSRARVYTDGLVARERRRDLIRFAKPVRIDLTEFLTAADRAIDLARTDPHAASTEGTRALKLYRGPLLLDQPHAHWTHAPRQHAAHRHRHLLDAVAHANGQLGHPG